MLFGVFCVGVSFDVCSFSVVVGMCLLFIGRWLIVLGFSLFGVRCSVLVVCCWFVAAFCCLSFVVPRVCLVSCCFFLFVYCCCGWFAIRRLVFVWLLVVRWLVVCRLLVV